MTEEKQNNSETDDWLDDIEDEEFDAADLEPSDIDDLLDQDAQSDDTPEEDESELDQDGIDALFGNQDEEQKTEDTTGEKATEELAVEEDDSGELDQANIDALLGGQETETPAEELEEEDDSVELAQANIDALLGGQEDKQEVETSSEEENGDTDAFEELDQDSIDELFGNNEEDTPQTDAAPPEEDVEENDGADQKDVNKLQAGEKEVPTEETEDSSGLKQEMADEASATEEDFVSELDDMDNFFSDLDEDDNSEDPFQSEDLDFSAMLADDEEDAGDPGAEEPESTAGEKKDSGEDTVGMGDDEIAQVMSEGQEDGKENEGSGFVLPAFLASMDRKLLSAVAACLLLLISVSLFLFLGDDEELPLIPLPEENLFVKTEKQTEINSIPVAENNVLLMGEKGGEISIVLKAEDADNDPLVFEISSQPEFGILSGEPPELTYLPNKKFAGEDYFKFKVGDGKSESAPATIIITGPNLALLAKAEEKKGAETEIVLITPDAPAISAAEVALQITSTDEIVIDWAEIWQELNGTPFHDKIYVDQQTAGLHGRLIKMTNGQSQYIPDNFFTGQDVIRYRFKQGGLSSPVQRVNIKVKLGSPPPEINLKQLAKGYSVG
ncbi:MAG: Ig-like domain-containing protein, partial [Thermodesulfobacteriota bacterium]|nr:Ig-like domain-containing protein [Thermodesulfobacteriota bacterium]